MGFQTVIGKRNLHKEKKSPAVSVALNAIAPICGDSRLGAATFEQFLDNLGPDDDIFGGKYINCFVVKLT